MSDSELIIIAAMSTNRVIGKNGKLPWSIKPDLARFRDLTSGHPVIMGRYTWESLNRKPLPNRFNIVVTTNIPRTMTADIHFDNLSQPVYTNSLKHAEYLAQMFNAIRHLESEIKKIFIIGGFTIYQQMIDSAQRMYLTLIDTEIQTDWTIRYFPNFSQDRWKLISRTDHDGTGESGPSGANYSFLEYEAI